MILRPSNCLLQKRKLPLNVRLSRCDFEGPVSNREANMIEPGNELAINSNLFYSFMVPGSSNTRKIFFRDPCIPVIAKDVGRGGPIYKLTESPFINNTRISRVVEN